MSVTTVGEVLIDEAALRQRIEELGEEISADYDGREVLLVGVLKGAVFFMADLMRQLSLPCEIDFMAISSYGEGTDRPVSSGSSRISTATSPIAMSSSSRTSSTPGLTLSYLMRNLGARRARLAGGMRASEKRVSTARRETDVPVKYVGFEIPNRCLWWGTASISGSATATCRTLCVLGSPYRPPPRKRRRSRENRHPTPELQAGEINGATLGSLRSLSCESYSSVAHFFPLIVIERG